MAHKSITSKGVFMYRLTYLSNRFGRLFISCMCLHLSNDKTHRTKLRSMINGFLKSINGGNKAQFIYISIRIMVIFTSFKPNTVNYLVHCCSIFLSNFFFCCLSFIYLFYAVLRALSPPPAKQNTLHVVLYC